MVIIAQVVTMTTARLHFVSSQSFSHRPAPLTSQLSTRYSTVFFGKIKLIRAWLRGFLWVAVFSSAVAPREGGCCLRDARDVHGEGTGKGTGYPGQSSTPGLSAHPSPTPLVTWVSPFTEHAATSVRAPVWAGNVLTHCLVSLKRHFQCMRHSCS